MSETSVRTAVGATTGFAEVRVHRAIAVALGASVAAYLIADLPAIRSQLAHLPGLWNGVAIAGQAAGAVALVVVPWFSAGRATRVAAASFALFGIVWLALLPVWVGFGGVPESDGLVWLARGQTSYAVAAVLAYSRGWAWMYVGASSAVGFLASTLTASAGGLRQHAEDLVVHLSTVIPFVVVVMLALRVARATDAAAAAALDAALGDSASAARAIERRRVELLAHDDLLSVLRAASSPTRPPAADLARAALEVQARLAQLAAEPSAEPVDAAEFVLRIRDLTNRLAPEVDVEVDTDTTAIPTVSTEAHLALLDACGEALRNSVRHAGEGEVRRVVVVRGLGNGVAVSITDDGAGFLPRAVPAHRLGIARSIEARMAALPGGSATIGSAPGTGTQVLLEWHDGPEPRA